METKTKHMKLKESTFAIIAEKKDSISHKWFLDNLNSNLEAPTWFKDRVYEFTMGRFKGITYESYYRATESEYQFPIYTESEFEAILKAEKEPTATATNSITLPSNAKSDPYNKQGFSPLSNMKDPVKATESNQVIFTYQTAIDLLAYYTKIDKGIIKIEMP